MASFVPGDITSGVTVRHSRSVRVLRLIAIVTNKLSLSLSLSLLLFSYQIRACYYYRLCDGFRKKVMENKKVSKFKTRSAL